MSEARSLRRVVAEIDAAASQAGVAAIGNRSIHQFWHLFAAEFRGVLLAPRRRPDSGNITWSWREPPDGPPFSAAELAEVRHRLTNANRSLQGRAGVMTGDHDDGESDSLEGQVRLRVGRMTAELLGKSDTVLAGYVGRTENGPMLHSWGAASPARPTFLDSQPGEISGSVLVDGTGTGGVTLTLSAEDGAATLRTKTSRDGTFRFSNVPPSNYRLCVVEREDFPVAGLPIQMERTAITGIELRNNPVATADRAQADSGAVRSRRWPVAVLVLLVVGSGSVIYWRYARQTPVNARQGTTATGWQTATGKLSAATTESASPEAKRSGAAGAWSDLSHKLPEPKLSAVGLHSRTAVRNRANENPRQSENAEDLTPTAPLDAAARERATDDGPMVHCDPLGGAAGGAEPPRNIETSSAGKLQAAEKQASADIAVSARATNTPTSQERSVRERAPVMIPGSSAAARDVTDTDEKGSNSALHVEAPATWVAPVRANSESDSSLSGGPRPDNTSGRSGSDSGAKGAGGSLAAGSPGSATEATSHLAARQGNGRHERTGAIEGAGTSLLFRGPAASDAAKSDAKDSVANLSSEVAATASVQENADANKKHPTDQPDAGTPGKDSSGERAEAMAVPVAPMPKPATKVLAAGQTTGRDIASADRIRDEQFAGRKLITLGTIGTPVWKAQLVRDAIVPTFPVAEGHNESLAELRRQSLAAERTRLPGVFRAPVTWRGFAVEFSAGGAPAGLAWKAGGDVRATVAGNRAELAWTDENPPADREYVLTLADGREIARASVNFRGIATLRTSADVFGWYWLGIEGNSMNRSDPESVARRLKWRLLSGEALPPTWRSDDNWRDGRGWRIEMPLVPTERRTDNAVALVDAESGWALGAEIQVR